MPAFCPPILGQLYGLGSRLVDELGRGNLIDNEINYLVDRSQHSEKNESTNECDWFNLISRTSAGQRAMRVIGSKAYVRCYERDRQDAEWWAVTIDLAKA